MMTTDARGVPTEMADLIPQTIEGLTGFVETEVLPLERELGTMLTSERRFFDETGKAVDEVMAAKTQIRMKSAAAGYYAMFAPEAVGGSALGVRAMVLVEEALYRRYGPGRPLITWAKGFLTQPPIAFFVDGPSDLLSQTSDRVRKEIIPRITNGEQTVCFGLTEANAGSDVWGIQMRAKRDGDDWVINGSKQWITNSPYADYAVVFAVTDEDMLAARKGGISTFIVDTTSRGYTFDGVLPTMGHDGGDCGAFTLDDVRVPADALVGDENQGFRVAMSGIAEGRMFITANCLGMAEYALDRSLEYSQQRRTFGQPIAEHQAIQFMLSDMAIEIYTMKYMALQTGALIDAGQSTIKEVSMSKAYAVERTQACFDRAIQIHGGMGLSNELALNEGMRIARTLRIPDGTGEIQRRTIARQMLRGDTVF